MNYDPYMVCSGNMALQTVRLTFAQRDYKKTFEAKIGGNCTGLTVIEAAINNVYDNLPRKLGATLLVLERGEDTLEVGDEDGAEDDWLKRMLVAAEIVAIEPDPRTAARLSAA